MKIKVSLNDCGAADGNHIEAGKPLDVISVDATGFYVIDGAGKVYRTSVGLENSDVWEIISVSHADGETIYKKQATAKTAPAKPADTPEHKDTKSSHRAHGSGHKE